MLCHAIQRGHMGSTRVGQEGEGVEGEMWKSLYCGFLRRNWPSKVSRFQIGFLNSFTRIQGMGAVPSSWLPGPGVNRAGEYLENKNLIWEGGGSVGRAGCKVVFLG